MSSNTRIQRKPVGNTRNVRYHPVDQNLDHLNNDRHQVDTCSTFPPANQIPVLVNDGPDQEFIELVDRAFDQSGTSVPSPQVQSPKDVRISLLSGSEAATTQGSETWSGDPGNIGQGADQVRNSDGSAYTAQSKPSHNLVKWRMSLSKQVQMIGYVLLGVILAAGHHLFFSPLNTTVVGSTSQ
jgi:hypothetical protein